MFQISNVRRFALVTAATGGIVALVAPKPAGAAGTAALALTGSQVASCASSVSLSMGSEGLRALKAEAILEGAPSALERIRLAQSGLAAPDSAESSADGATACRIAHSPLPTVQLPSELAESSVRAQPSNSEAFLDSRRVPIASTRFDDDWARVSARHLSARSIERSMGSPAEDRLALIGQINRWVNRTVAYRPDSARYHGGDYWADARQTLRTRSGDCEDIAILKYQALLALGVPPDDIYFTMARDLVRHADHALVVVNYKGRYFLLDDSTDALLDGSQSNEYQPILSFGQGKWIHGLTTDRASTVYLSRNELSNPRVMGVVR